MSLKLISLTVLTMLAFAANSIFGRLALIDSANDPLSFTLVRLFAGAMVLSFVFFKHRTSESLWLNKGTLLPPAMLFLYALFFSLSYVQMDAGTGALILFAVVQITMMVAAYFRGQRLGWQERIGVTLAILGFVYLLLPGASMPPPLAASLMVISGISWGMYSILGQGAKNPIAMTSRNFVLTTPFVVFLMLIFSIHLTPQGMMWAVLSGALTSGIGYVLWYIVLKDLTTSTAAIVQLSVPALAAFGGVLFLGENVSMRLLLASALIFTGIFLKVRGLNTDGK